LSRYEIIETLGKGGMGEVLKAQDTQLKRTVAIKGLLPGSFGNEEARARFLREARLAAQLNHPNIATIYDILDSDGQLFIVMEFIEGETLRDRVSRGPLPLAQALDFSSQIASALAAAHREGVIHRDIKSENIKVTPGGYIKVLDFGLATRVYTVDPTVEQTVKAESMWVTQQGFVGGTPGYTAPEQWRGDPVDGRADIFSFGVVLYEMITGRTAFPGQSVIERIAATMHQEPEPVTHFTQVPTHLERVVRKALAKDPKERYQSMTELLLELEALKRQPAAVAQPTPVSEREILVGRYRILTELGEGGMGKVYKARDQKLDRVVAIKELRPGALGDEIAKARFLREANLLAQLNHPHIATIHDIVEEDDQIFIVMEYIEGERLLDKVKHGPLPSGQAYQYALETAEALAEAHSRRIIHRDIKSANIMITPGGHVKVLDFGLAKQLSPAELSQTGMTQTVAAGLTASRITFGTPKYMSPEQRTTADVDERSDIFSYGVVLSEMLAGEFIYTGEALADILEADPQPLPPPLGKIQPHWRPLLKKSLARSPEQRYQTVTDLVADLKRLKDAALVAPTELATGVIERPRVVEAVKLEPKVVPTLIHCVMALAPSLYFFHLVSESADTTEGAIYLVMTFVFPPLLFLVERLIKNRLTLIRRFAGGTDSRTLVVIMLNLLFVFCASVSLMDMEQFNYQWLGDWRYLTNVPRANPDIVLIAVDEHTKEELARTRDKVLISNDKDLWKLRKYHTELLNQIKAHGKPKVIAFDTYFSDPKPELDGPFEEALREVRSKGIPVVIGQLYEVTEKGFRQTTDTIHDAVSGDKPIPPIGHPIVLPGLDDIVRTVPLVIREEVAGQEVLGIKNHPSISLLMFTGGEFQDDWLYQRIKIETPREIVPLDDTIQYVKELPNEHFKYQNLVVNYPADRFERISYVDALEPSYYAARGDVFKDKYVLIGMAKGEYEPPVKIPNDRWVHRFEIHAAALNTMLEKSFITRLDKWYTFGATLLCTFLIFTFSIMRRESRWGVPVLVLIVCAVMFGTAYLLWILRWIWFEASYPMWATVASGLLVWIKRS
jgi:serine/threonine protein kinase